MSEAITGILTSGLTVGIGAIILGTLVAGIVAALVIPPVTWEEEEEAG